MIPMIRPVDKRSGNHLADDPEKRPFAAAGGLGNAGSGDHHRGEKYPAGDAGHQDRTHNPTRHAVRGRDGLLGGMRRGVKAGDRVGRQQGSQGEKKQELLTSRPGVSTGAPAVVGECDQARDIQRRGESQQADREQRGNQDDPVAAEVE